LGALWVTQALLPLLREQGGGGHIIQVSDRRRRGFRLQVFTY
jgi:NAD(P)-dependent dehydrogenase (short-subunit alcohol dehydrogenase family)